MSTNVEITATQALAISTENRNRCISNLEQIYLQITLNAHRGIHFYVAKELKGGDYRALLANGFKIKPWYYNQYHIEWSQDVSNESNQSRPTAST